MEKKAQPEIARLLEATIVEIGLESLGKSECGGQPGVLDKGARAVSRFTHVLGKRDDPIRQSLAVHVDAG